MRPVIARSLPLFVLATLALAACAAPEGDDDAEGQTSNVTGGGSTIESPVAYLFESADPSVAPKCVGAMLSDTIAVTARACAKEGLIVGRAADKDGRGERAKVKAVHTPDARDAEIALVELDKPLEGWSAVITHMPLRSGYAINGVAAKDGSGFLSPDKGEASSVKGTMIEENAAFGTVVPEQGAEICEGDLGAPVCSSTGASVAGFNIFGTCGLSGLVVGPVDAVNGATAPPPLGGSAGNAPNQGDAPAATPGCSGKKWRVAQLGRYADFLKTHAPKAFEPMRIDKFLIRRVAYVPEGLWGYKTKGEIASCKIETPTLSDVKPNTATAAITAKVAFKAMDKRAAAWGRFGIAPKDKPAEMRWLPARALDATRGEAFEARFEGIVSADKVGDYIVAFRASANGGESWTPCDTDGIDNGFSEAKALGLKVSETAGTPGQTPPPGQDPGSQPQDAPQGPSDDYSDPPPATDDSSSTEDVGDLGGGGESEDDLVPAPKKKSKDDGGCSASGASPASGMPILGALLGLAALSRRRRR